MLDQKTFVCDRKCGECCIKLIVKLNKPDIKRIKKLGCKENDFVELDYHLLKQGMCVLKKKSDYNDGCIFLERNKQGLYSCKIYNARPLVCKEYPFLKRNAKTETCKPKLFGGKKRKNG